MDDARAASDEGPFLQRTWANDISAESALPYLAYTGPHDPSNPAAIEALLRAYRSEVLLRYAAWAAARAPHAAPLQPIPLRFAEQRLWLPRMVFDEEDGLPSDEPIFDDLLGRLRRWHELVLIGPAGSGKSTALWQLAHDLAHSGLAARADAELPVVVELADQPAEPDRVALLQAALRGASLTGRDGEPRPLEAHRMLAALIPQILARRPVALLWDGLDQVARGSAGQITRAIAAVTRTTGGLISLVTCRADRYPSFSGQGGLHVAIRQAAALPLDAAATRALASGQIGADRGAQLLEQMALPTFGGQRAFAQSPLLLSMLCEVYASDGSLPESQGALLARWAARRLAAARERTSPAVTAEVGLRGIAQLAIAITSSYGRGAAAPLGWALDQIRSAAPGADPDEIAGLARQAGLVVRSGDALRFTHALLQEYFAALALQDLRSAPPLIAGREWPDGWEETLLMLGSITGARGPHRAQLREALRAHMLPAAQLLASAPGGPEPALAELLREIASAAIGAPDTGLRRRIEAGQTLGLVGDLRSPVTIAAWIDQITRRSVHFGEPDGYWCAVQTGVYSIGGWSYGQPSAEIALGRFWIAVLPISVAQFAPFAQIGYAESAQRWWTPSGWAWRSARGRVTPDHWGEPGYSAHSQPVVGVSWYEARAFCAWLTESLGPALPPGLVVRLPTEAEWEAAAAFDQHRRRPYPWGDAAPTPERAITSVANLHTPAPVGICPAGAAACGALDMLGNVEEWCHSTFGDYPAGSHEGTHDAPSGGDIQLSPLGPQQLAARGGWWAQKSDQLSCGSRFWRYASAASYTTGFRVVLAAPLA